MAAIATLITYALMARIIRYFALRSFSFRIDWIFIAKSIVASAIMSLVIWALNPVGVLQVLLAIIGGAAIYFTIIFLTRGFNREEISFFRRLFQRGSSATNSDDKAR